MTLLVGSSEP